MLCLREISLGNSSAILDTNNTSYESNFIAGFVRDLYGNVNVAGYPTIPDVHIRLLAGTELEC